ncbi:MAG: hypothetical protein ACEQSR_06530 [Candidatus Methylacidiphilales bacterium]
MTSKESLLKPLNKLFPDYKFETAFLKHKIFIAVNNKKLFFDVNDWLHKNDIVLSIIASILGQNKTIFARNCQVKKVDKAIAESFLNENHLLGYLNAYYKYALFFDNEIIALATFSKGRKMNRLSSEKRGFELISFCCKKHISVTGGLSKLLKAFVTDLQPGDIMTYVDKDWSEGKAYLKIGFKLHSETPPQSFLFNTKTFTKHKISNDFELENIQDKDTILVKNSGNLKLVYTL